MPQSGENSQASDLSPIKALRFRHITALDGLRGVAILMVMLFHFGAEVEEQNHYSLLCKPLRLGWTGVDLFFALSGFLITGILLETRDRPHYFRNFYARRTLRIFPLYFLVLGAIAILCLIFSGMTNWVGATLSTQRWYWVYASNILMTLRGDWIGPLDHFWSLAVEEHFYLVWPLIVLLLTRRQLLATCAIVVITAVSLRYWLSADGNASLAGYILTPCRMDGLATGAAVAILIRTRLGRQLLSRWTWPVIFLSLAALVAVDVKAHGYADMRLPVQRIGYSLSAVLFAAVVGMAAFPAIYRPRIFIAVLEFPLLRLFGRYSYAMYIFHPLLENWRRWMFRNWTGGSHVLFFFLYLIVAIASAFLPAMLSWHLFEKPILGLKRYFETQELRATKSGDPVGQAAVAGAVALPSTAPGN